MNKRSISKVYLYVITKCFKLPYEIIEFNVPTQNTAIYHKNNIFIVNKSQIKNYSKIIIIIKTDDVKVGIELSSKIRGGFHL